MSIRADLMSMLSHVYTCLVVLFVSIRFYPSLIASYLSLRVYALSIAVVFLSILACSCFVVSDFCSCLSSCGQYRKKFNDSATAEIDTCCFGQIV